MPSKSTKNVEKDEPGFEAAMGELEEILERMGKNETPLDEAVELYAKAAELIETCGRRLKTAQVRVEEIGAELNDFAAPEEPDEL